MFRFLKGEPGRALLMDGAMGTELMRAGAKPGECFELWNLTHPERVRAVHEAYVRAGARILVANTFQANPTALARHGAASRLGEIIRAGVKLARAATGDNGTVLASVGPMASCADHDAAAILDAAADADGILLETMSASEEPATFARATLGRTPLLLSFSFLRKPPGGELQTYGGFAPEECARRATDLDAAALGVNCGRDIDVDAMIEIVRRYRAATTLPLFARPNAGTPRETHQGLAHPHSPRALASRVPELMAAGATMLGGCCGTTPETIAAFRAALEALQFQH